MTIFLYWNLTYLTNINFPASVLTGSTRFHDSLSVFFVSADKGTAIVFTLADGRCREATRWWSEAEQPIGQPHLSFNIWKEGMFKYKIQISFKQLVERGRSLRELDWWSFCCNFKWRLNLNLTLLLCVIGMSVSQFGSYWV